VVVPGAAAAVIVVREVFKKFCDLSTKQKKNACTVNYSLFLSVVTTEFNALVALYCQTVYAVKITALSVVQSGFQPKPWVIFLFG